MTSEGSWALSPNTDPRITHIAEACGVSTLVAQIALAHAHQSVSICKELMCNETFRARVEREAREIAAVDPA